MFIILCWLYLTFGHNLHELWIFPCSAQTCGGQRWPYSTVIHLLCMVCSTLLLVPNFFNSLKCPITQLGGHYDYISKWNDWAFEIAFPCKIILNPNSIMQIVTNIKTKKRSADWLLALPSMTFDFSWLKNGLFPGNKMCLRKVKCSWKPKLWLFSFFFLNNHSSVLWSSFWSPHLAQGFIHHAPHLCHVWLMHAFDGSHLQKPTMGVFLNVAFTFCSATFCLHKQPPLPPSPHHTPASSFWLK